MLKNGVYHKLTIDRDSDYGLYLINNEGDEVLLPNRYVPANFKIGDEMEVFVYGDSEDRPVATTETPFAKVGEAAYLRVVDKTIHGAFVDWGLLKDLFVPIRNQQSVMEVGRSYIVYVYEDSLTGRVVASAKLNPFIKNEEITLHPRQKVDIMVAYPANQGFRVIINNKYWGMLYDNQLFQKVYPGDRFEAHVVRITEDNRIDISLQQQGFDEVKIAANKLLEIIELKGGTLNLCDDSSPERVTELTNMSKKVFKRSVGYLLKREKIELVDGKIKMILKHKKSQDEL